MACACMAQVGFMLKPFGFFSGNPAVDLPYAANAASKLDGACCANGGAHANGNGIANGNGVANGNGLTNGHH